ncbi:MAG: thiol:disulfide interchange protein DsbA/DsbL [Gammaproteobacteria bacterium]|nr:thiol:disulfide interchange protein DsbA/DsbL [Gammaproteobacteria bacterium]MBV9697173.1 thiol:disulfide interchange protein DsbA/DsbL [Gammaproteobacteria bacterium]
MPRRLALLSAAAALLGLMLASVHTAAQPSDYFRVLDPPQPPGAPGKIEVIEFFSYGCPHCAEFAPLVTTWSSTLPKDVAFKRVPVGFNRPAWVNLQRAWYALQASGDVALLDAALFKAIHEQHLQLFDAESLTEWVGKNGGHADKFAAAYASFGVNNQTVQADTLAENYHIDSIPTMAVNGRYAAQGATFSEILANTSRLIDKVRSEQPRPKK